MKIWIFNHIKVIVSTIVLFLISEPSWAGEWIIFNPHIFSGSCPDLAILDWFIGVALSLFTYLLVPVLAIMFTQRS